MSQLQVTGEAKIRNIQGPVVANSGVITALDGAASQYVRGDGTLADFPTSSGGGSSVSYYLNSSVSQGTIGGVAYRELSKDPIIGAGTDIAISANGYVANYITDVNDPDVTIVPGGNFNCEFYFSVNNNTGNPTFYAELYKYDGTTFTLLGSSAGVPESINQGTTIAPYYFAIPVATAALALTDRLAIRIYVNVSGRTVTLHTENGHLCQVVTTLSKGMVSLNNLTDQSQFITTGTAGTDFTIASSGDTHTFNLPVASAINTGKLNSSDWSVFNNKQNALTNPVTGTGTTNTLPKFTAASTIGNSNVTDSGTLITLGSNAYVTNNLGLGNSSLTQYGFRNSLNITGAGNSTANYSDGQILSGVVGRASYYETFANTAAASFTNAALYHYRANQSTFGASSVVTNQYGYSVESTLIGATNNYGFFGNIPSGTNRWNLYMSGTAANYMAGKLLVGSTTDAGAFALQVTGDIIASRVYSTGITDGVSYALNNNRSIRNIGGTTGTGTTFFDLNYSVFRREDGASTGARIGINIVPTETLDVNGTARISGNVTSNVQFISNNGTVETRLSYSSTPAGVVGTISNHPLEFYTNSNAKMVLSTSGNLGLGVTPTSTWDRVAFEIGVAGSAITRDTRDLLLMSNTIRTSGGYVYAATAGASRFELGVSSFRWFTAPSGTGGNAITFTQAMTLDNNGALGIGSTSLTGYTLRLGKSVTGAANYYAIESAGTVQSDVTGSMQYFQSVAATQATTFTLGALRHYFAFQSTFGAGSTVTTQIGYFAHESLVGATNNFGFYGNIPSGTNRWNLYMSGTANNYMAGSLGIGATNLTGVNLFVSKTLTGGVDSYHVNVNGIIQSDVTNSATYFRSSASTAAASFTLGTLNHYVANQGSLGASSAITNQYGFVVNSNLTGATNNYGFYGNIPSGTNRWNLYMAGTANNYMAGVLNIGTTTLSGYTLDVNGTGRFFSNLTIGQTSYLAGTYSLDVITGGIAGIAEVARFASAGNGGTGRGGGIIISAPGSSNTVSVARLVGYQETASATANNASFAIQVANSSGVLTEYLKINNTGAATFSSTLNTGGNLTIGNQLANATLKIYADTGGGDGYIKFNADSDQTKAQIYGRKFAATGGVLEFATLQSSVLTTAMIINQVGNVGIATTSPFSKLGVKLANATAVSTIAGTTGWDSTYAVFGNPDSVTGQGFGIGTTNTLNGINLVSLNPTSDWVDTNYYSRNHIFYGGGIERARITSGGNVLVGTTTDSGEKMQVNGITKTAGLSLSGTTVSTTQTMTSSFYMWIFNGGSGQTLTLYSASGHNNTHFIKNSSANSLTLAASYIETLTSTSTVTSITIPAYKTVQVISNGGVVWLVMNQS